MRYFYLIILFISWQSSAQGLPRPSVRVFVFNSENKFEGTETTLTPTDNGLYEAKSINSLFTAFTDCQNDLLNRFQRRPLEVMVEKGVISQKLFAEIMAHFGDQIKARQIIIAQTYNDLPAAEAALLFGGSVPEERILDVGDSEASEDTIRIHRASVYGVRDYDIVRRHLDRFSLTRFQLPFEFLETLPDEIQQIDRTHIKASIEIGRAVVESGTLPGDLRLPLQFLLDTVTSDVSRLEIAPEEVAVFADATNSLAVAHYIRNFKMRPLNRKTQLELENHPREFLQNYRTTITIPQGDEWGQFDKRETILVASLAALQEKFPRGTLSNYVARLRTVAPTFLSNDALMDFIQIAASQTRRDFDVEYHGDGPGHQYPIQIRDFGTALLKMRFVKAVLQTGTPELPELINAMLKVIGIQRLSIDPDFGQHDWVERRLYVPLLNFSPNKENEAIPALTITNLDGSVPSAEQPRYLALIISGALRKIRAELASLDSNPNLKNFVFNDANHTRTGKGMTALAQPEDLNNKTFLETYDVLIGTNDTRLRKLLLNWGAEEKQALAINQKFKSGKLNIDISDFDQLKEFNQRTFQSEEEAHAAFEEFQRANQPAIQAFAQKLFNDHIKNLFEQVLVYRITPEMVKKMLANTELPMREDRLLPSFHKWKIERNFITYE
jgi:hypothetical protein